MRYFANRVKAWFAPVNKVAELMMDRCEGDDAAIDDIRMITEGLIALTTKPGNESIAIALCCSFLNGYINKTGWKLSPGSQGTFNAEYLMSGQERELYSCMYSSEVAI